MNTINSENLLFVLNYLKENGIQYISIDEFNYSNTYTISFIGKIYYKNKIYPIQSSIFKCLYNKILTKLKIEKL